LLIFRRNKTYFQLILFKKILLHCMKLFFLTKSHHRYRFNIIHLDNSRIKPNFIFAYQNEDVKFECLSSTTPTWLFQPKDGKLEKLYRANAVLHLSKVQKKNSGDFECQGTIEKNSKFAAKTELIVFGKNYYKLKTNNILNHGLTTLNEYL